MATCGFEFVGMVDGSATTPIIRDLPLDAASGGVSQGALCVIDPSTGCVEEVANDDVLLVTGVIMESIPAGSVVDGVTTVPVAIVTKGQIWRCSCNGVMNDVFIGIQALDLASPTQISATKTTGGSLILYDNSNLDTGGNTIAQVLFANCTF